MTSRELAENIYEVIDEACDPAIPLKSWRVVDLIESHIASAFAEEAFKHDAERAGWNSTLTLMLGLLRELLERMELINGDNDNCVHGTVNICANHALIQRVKDLLYTSFPH